MRPCERLNEGLLLTGRRHWAVPASVNPPTNILGGEVGRRRWGSRPAAARPGPRRRSVLLVLLYPVSPCTIREYNLFEETAANFSG